MKEYFERAVANVVAHGDTDIFPFPIENHVFFDRRGEIVELLLEVHKNFAATFTSSPPTHENLLAPVGYTGFRWASQLDPFWNLYFLGMVLSIGEEIEAARLPLSKSVVFSYRYAYDPLTSDIFRRDVGWVQFMEHSQTLASDSAQVVICDISDFYSRIGHHRLDNALKQIGAKNDAPARIMDFLSNFSNTRSYGLPVGGPSSRLLSEIVLNQVDRLLSAKGVKFCRFADDYHLFCDSKEAAYDALVFLSEKLFRNEGLSLQKSKTRVLSSAEFLATNPLARKSAMESEEPATQQQPDVEHQLSDEERRLLKFSIRFDPYSPTAHDDYEKLKSELGKFDILGMLRSELSKSRVHISLAKKVAAAIKFLDDPQKNGAIESLIENCELLYPIFSTIMVVIHSTYESLLPVTQEKVQIALRKLVAEESHILKVDLNLAFAVRVLGLQQSPENEELLLRIFAARASGIIRRDIVLIMAKWNAFYWLSDLRNDFRPLGAPVRRAFIVASYALGDEGRHWRDHMKAEFSPFEKIVRDWAAAKRQVTGWRIPV